MTFCSKQRTVSAASACEFPSEVRVASGSAPNQLSCFVTGTEASESGYSHVWCRNSNCYCAWIARNTWKMVFLLRSLLRRRMQTKTLWASSFESFRLWRVEIEGVRWKLSWSPLGRSCHWRRVHRRKKAVGLSHWWCRRRNRSLSRGGTGPIHGGDLRHELKRLLCSWDRGRMRCEGWFLRWISRSTLLLPCRNRATLFRGKWCCLVKPRKSFEIYEMGLVERVRWSQREWKRQSERVWELWGWEVRNCSFSCYETEGTIMQLKSEGD